MTTAELIRNIDIALNQQVEVVDQRTGKVVHTYSSRSVALLACNDRNPSFFIREVK